MSEARFGWSRCPGCGGALEALREEAIAGAASPSSPMSTAERVPPLSVCSACFGVWFDWWAGETTAISQSLLELPQSPRINLRGDGHCPRDGKALEPHAYLDSGPVVRRCPGCLGLFAGRAQIDELAAFAAHLPESHAPIEDRNVLARLWRLLS